MGWLKQALTGADNETVAIGRFIGVVLLAMVVAAPVVELATVIWKMLAIDDWGKMFAQWQVFIPVLIGTTIGVIAGTAFTEPKPPSGGSDAK